MQIKQHIIKEPELIAENSRYSGVSKSSIFGWNFFFGSFYKRENKNIKKVSDYSRRKLLYKNNEIIDEETGEIIDKKYNIDISIKEPWPKFMLYTFLFDSLSANFKLLAI